MEEYKVMYFVPKCPTEAVEFLNRFSGKGYELISVDGGYFYFKKKVLIEFTHT